MKPLHVPRLAATLSLAVIAAYLPAQRSSAPPPITLSEAIAFALANNADYRIAIANVDSAHAESRIARSFGGPSLATIPNNPFQYSVSMPVDLTPQRVYRTRAASLGIEAADADRRDAQRMLTISVARAFYDVLLAHDRLTIATQRRDALARVLVSDSVRVRAGDLAEHNLARSAVEYVRADAAVARASADLDVAKLTLQTTMGAPHPSSNFDVTGSLDYKRVDIAADSVSIVAARHRADLAAANARVDQSNASRGLARTAFIPTPQLSLVQQPNAVFENGHHYAVGVGFALPGLDVYSGTRDRAAAGLDAAKWRQRAASAQVEHDVRTAVAELDVQRTIVEKYQNGLLTKIAESVAATQYAYDRGAAPLLDVLDAIRAQQDARDDYSQALHDYWISIYELNAAAGTDVVTP